MRSGFHSIGFDTSREMETTRIVRERSYGTALKGLIKCSGIGSRGGSKAPYRFTGVPPITSSSCKFGRTACCSKDRIVVVELRHVAEHSN